MKKYLLTLLAIFVVLAPNVKAEECVNLLSSDTNFYYSNKGTGGWHGGIAFLNKTRFFAERPYEFFYTINISMSHFMKNYKYFNS